MLGAGLRPKHYPYLTNHTTQLEFFEIISENYMDTEGRPRALMRQLREKYPMCMHGVSMSLGSATGVNKDYLKKLKALALEVEPFLISDHLCFTGLNGVNSHDLLPLPFTREMIKIAVQNIEQVQNFLKTTIAVENVSSYLTWKENEMPEWEFIREIVRRAGCKVLLDINNIHVNATNHGFDPMAFVEAIDTSDVAEIHLAGFTDMEDYLFDTHSKPVHRDVWKLWASVAARFPGTPVMIERDAEIPGFPVLEREVLKAGHIRSEALAKADP